VGRHGGDVGAGRLGLELVEALLRDVDRDHAAALPRDTGCRRTSDAGTRAGHDDRLAAEASLADALDPLGTLDGGHALLARGFTLGRTGCRGIRVHVALRRPFDEFVEQLLAEAALAQLDE